MSGSSSQQSDRHSLWHTQSPTARRGCCYLLGCDQHALGFNSILASWLDLCVCVDAFARQSYTPPELCSITFHLRARDLTSPGCSQRKKCFVQFVSACRTVTVHDWLQCNNTARLCCVIKNVFIEARVYISTYTNVVFYNKQHKFEDYDRITRQKHHVSHFFRLRLILRPHTV